ncbi:MAG: hypothetical protein RL748_4150 [Pseudomonadota bacterium]
MRTMSALLLKTSIAAASLTLASTTFAGELKIHAINVGWGQSVLVEGPNGTKLMFDTGLASKKEVVVNYLKNRGIAQLDHLIISHNHADHAGSAEYVVRAAKPKNSYYSGSKENLSATFMKNWMAAYSEVKMPKPVAMQLGYKIDLGDGASATAVAADCKVLHQTEVIAKLSKEQPGYVFPDCGNANDASIVMLIKYKGFDYLVSGDLGGHDHNGQGDFETPVVTSLMLATEPELKIANKGIDVLHLGHHGSRTSSNEVYAKLGGPEVALVSVGPNQSHGLPNVEAIQPLLDMGTIVLQTDEGDLGDSRAFKGGFAVGTIVISTDGAKYTVDADPASLDLVKQPNTVSEYKKAGLPFTRLVDGGGVPPVVDKASPTATASLTGSAARVVLKATVADDVGVTQVDFLVDGKVVATQNFNPAVKRSLVSQPYNASKLSSAKHSYQAKVSDASGKTGVSLPVSVK